MTQTEHRAEPAIAGENVLPLIIRMSPERMGEEMFVALKNGETHRLRHLLAMGGDPDSRAKDGYTLLMTAVKDNAEDAVDALLSAYADINALGPDGKNAILLAAGGNPSIARTLIEHYADLSHIDPSSPDAAEAAKRSGNYSLAAEIEMRKNNENYQKAVERKKKEIAEKKEERSRLHSMFCSLGESLSSAYDSAAETTRSAKDYIVEKTVKAKDKTVRAAKAFAAVCSRQTHAITGMCSKFIADFRLPASAAQSPSVEDFRNNASEMLALHACAAPVPAPVFAPAPVFS